MQNINKLYVLISSMKTGLLLLVSICIVSAIGSALVPDSFFQSKLFKLLILLLSLNMTLCTISRLRAYKKGLLKGWKNNKLWWRQTGILFLHAGLLVILVGAIINSSFGNSARLNVLQGDTADVASIMELDNPLFVKLEEFNIEFNDDGSPAQYYSSVKVYEDKTNTTDYTISVNHPLKYGGVKAYQQSFGYLLDAEYADNSETKISGLFSEGEVLELPSSERLVKVYKYIPDFDPANAMNSNSLRPDNPRVIFSVYENKKLLGVGTAAFGERIDIDDGIYVKFKGVEPFSVLKVKTDPGLPTAAIGSLMFILGVCLFLLSPQRAMGKTEFKLER